MAVDDLWKREHFDDTNGTLNSAVGTAILELDAGSVAGRWFPCDTRAPVPLLEVSAAAALRGRAFSQMPHGES